MSAIFSTEGKIRVAPTDLKPGDTVQLEFGWYEVISADRDPRTGRPRIFYVNKGKTAVRLCCDCDRLWIEA